MNDLPEEKMKPDYGRLFIVLTLTLCILRVIISALFPLSSDEAYHWEWSRHLAPGYYDHPPLTAYVIFFFTRIFGDTEVGVRFGAIVLMSLASGILYKLGFDISGDKLVAFWSGMLMNIVPILSIFFVYMSTDPPTLFFWSLMLWLGYRAVIQERKGYWYLFGLALGGALFTKFLSIFFIPSLGLFILLSSNHRRLFISKEPYLAGIIAFVLIIPFLRWNAENNWATFDFNFARRQSAEFSLFNFLEYIGGQAIIVSPFIFAGYIYSSVVCWIKGYRERNVVLLYLASSSSVMFCVFLLVSFMRSVGAHWTASTYIATCACLPYFAFVEGNSFIRRHARKAVILAILIIIIAHTLLFSAYFFPTRTADFISRLKIQSDAVYEMHGFSELGAIVEARAKQMDAIIITPSYAFSSMLGFYTPSKMQCHLFGRGGVHGLNYLFWDGDFSQFKGRNAIWAYRKFPKQDIIISLRNSFESVGDVEEYYYIIGGRKVRTFYFIECTNLIEYRPE